MSAKPIPQEFSLGEVAATLKSNIISLGEHFNLQQMLKEIKNTMDLDLKAMREYIAKMDKEDLAIKAKIILNMLNNENINFQNISSENITILANESGILNLKTQNLKGSNIIDMLENIQQDAKKENVPFAQYFEDNKQTMQTTAMIVDSTIETKNELMSKNTNNQDFSYEDILSKIKENLNEIKLEENKLDLGSSFKLKF